MHVSILLILFIFAIVTQAWSDPDNSMHPAVNQITTMKVDENRNLAEKKKKSAQKPVQSLKKGKSKPQAALRCLDDGASLASTKRDVDFLKAVELKRKARWIDLDQILSSAEFLPSSYHKYFLTSREVPANKPSSTDFNQSLSRLPVAGNKYFHGGTKLEIFRHLESKKEELLREIFMGFRFSFSPPSRHVVLEMNVIPSYEGGPGLIIPF